MISEHKKGHAHCIFYILEKIIPLKIIDFLLQETVHSQICF
ncbi:hypothetical protein Mpsy_1699 [Methanolobus psychrophilus R15]|nr:hypothetical protein Mpsy_1699 [Methanolobus psychrophilus R15]